MEHSFPLGQNLHSREIPEIVWTHGDDLCNCVFQRIGDWSNPYLGRTLRVRVCCMEQKMFEDYPEFVQEIPAFWDANTDTWVDGPLDWDGEDDMPRHLWHRQVAILTGLSLDETRVRFEGEEPPKGIERPSKPPEQRRPMSAEEIIGRQLIELNELQSQLDATVSVIHMLKNETVTLEQIELRDGGFSVTDFEQTKQEPVA